MIPEISDFGALLIQEPDLRHIEKSRINKFLGSITRAKLLDNLDPYQKLRYIKIDKVQCYKSKDSNMSDLCVSVYVYSPRWGHPDEYIITFNDEELKVDLSQREAVCTQSFGSDPKWTGYNDISGNPLLNIFSNEHIYAPEIVVDALESLWDMWHDSESSDIEIEQAIRDLFDWIDLIAKNKPKNELLIRIF